MLRRRKVKETIPRKRGEGAWIDTMSTFRAIATATPRKHKAISMSLVSMLIATCDRNSTKRSVSGAPVRRWLFLSIWDRQISNGLCNRAANCQVGFAIEMNPI